MLPKENRITKAKDFRYISRHGKTIVLETVFIKILTQSSETHRSGAQCGLIVSKKYGNSVARKECSRVIRHWCREWIYDVPDTVCCIVRPKKGIRNVFFTIGDTQKIISALQKTDTSREYHAKKLEKHSKKNPSENE